MPGWAGCHDDSVRRFYRELWAEMLIGGTVH